jgi:uncharacterized protein DUF6463
VSVRTRASTGMPAREGHRPVVGVSLAVIGVTHLALTPVLYGTSLRSVLDAGVVAAVDADPAMADLRSASLWYVTAGLALLLIAGLVAHAERVDGVPPAVAVVGLLVIAGVGLLLTPASGFLAVFAVALFAGYRRRRASRLHGTRSTPDTHGAGGHR